MENGNYKPNRYARRHPAVVARAVATSIANGFTDAVAMALRSPLTVSPIIGIESYIIGPSCQEKAKECLFHRGEDGLLELGENWQSVDTEDLENALGKAKKVKATAKDDDGNTVLHFAARYAKPEVIPVLINHGAEVNAKNKKDDAPLHWAAEYANAEMISALHNAGANLNIKNHDGNTPLHLRASAKNILDENTKAICALIEAGANVKAKNAKGLTPLYYAVKHKHLHIAELLKTADAK